MFAEEPFHGLKKALMEYLSKFRERLKILNSKRRYRSIPPDQVHSFPGLKSVHTTVGLPGIVTAFNDFSMDHYKRLLTNLELPDSPSLGQMELLQTVISYEIGYLRGCDLRWEETEGDDNADADAADEESTPAAADAESLDAGDGKAVSSGKGASAGDGASQTQSYITGNRVEVKYDDGIWYPGTIIRIDSLENGEINVYVNFDDGDKTTLNTRDGGYIEGFRHDPAREKAEITKWSVLHRFLVTSSIGADGRARTCPVTSQPLDRCHRAALISNIMKGSFRNAQLYEKIKLFLLNVAKDLKPKDQRTGSGEEAK